MTSHSHSLYLSYTPFHTAGLSVLLICSYTHAKALKLQTSVTITVILRLPFTLSEGSLLENS